jgi:hypothetical protein
MKKYLLFLLVLTLSACASPAANMSSQQVASLSDQQLCNLQWNYPYEAKTEVEIGRRNLNCDPAYLECKSSGLKDGSPSLSHCIKTVQERNVLAQQVQIQQQLTIQDMLWNQQLRQQQQDQHDAYMNYINRINSNKRRAD